MPRRVFLLVLCLLLVGLPAAAAIAIVPGGGGTQQTTSGTTVTVTIATPGSGNALILTYGCNPNTASISEVVKPVGGGVTWAKAIGSTTNRCAEIWYGLNSSGSGTSVVITLVGALSGSGGIVNISEWSGVVTSSPLDGTAATNSGTSATPATASITLSEATSLIIAVERGAHAAFSSGPDNSFLSLTSPVPASFQAAYYLPGGTSSYSTGWTFGASAIWNTAIAAFKAAAGGSTLPAAILNNPVTFM